MLLKRNTKLVWYTVSRKPVTQFLFLYDYNTNYVLQDSWRVSIMMMCRNTMDIHTVTKVVNTIPPLHTITEETCFHIEGCSTVVYALLRTKIHMTEMSQLVHNTGRSLRKSKIFETSGSIMFDIVTTIFACTLAMSTLYCYVTAR